MCQSQTKPFGASDRSLQGRQKFAVFKPKMDFRSSLEGTETPRWALELPRLPRVLLGPPGTSWMSLGHLHPSLLLSLHLVGPRTEEPGARRLLGRGSPIRPLNLGLSAPPSCRQRPHSCSEGTHTALESVCMLCVCEYVSVCVCACMRDMCLCVHV